MDKHAVLALVVVLFVSGFLFRKHFDRLVEKLRL